MDQMDQLVQAEMNLGNTSPDSKNTPKRISPSKSWCFTYHNYTMDQVDQMVQTFEHHNILYVMGYEICPTTGTPHIQGYCHHKKTKFRPIEKFQFEFHPKFIKCKGNLVQNYNYCSKGKDFITNIDIKEYGEEELDYEEPYGWQIQIMDIIKNKPDKRTIHWFWEPNGNIGKSELCRYLCIKHDAIICSGTAKDMKYMCATAKKKPKIIIFDVPRSCLEYISYTGIEEIKNGVFCSSKYESSMCVMNRPHIIIFANEPPLLSKMSQDRWNVVHINTE